MTLKASVSIGWVNTVIAAAERLGVNAELLLGKAGIAQEKRLLERWPIDDITRLWHAAETCTGDTGLGLKVGQWVSPASLSVVGFAMQSAASLREAFNMVQRFLPLVSDGGRFQMLAGAHTTWIVYHPRQGQLSFSPHQIEAVLSAVMTLTSWISGQTMPPNHVQFSQPQLGPMQGYRDTFHCPVTFEQAFSGLLVDNSLLDHPLPQADAQLARLHTQYTENRLAALDRHTLDIVTLRQWFNTNFSTPLPKRSQIAAAFGISERTLARRLKLQGSSFEQLLDHVRKEKALELVRDTKQSLSDIAQTLGFAEISPFYRAFQRWTGMPPARWRKEQLKRCCE